MPELSPLESWLLVIAWAVFVFGAFYLHSVLVTRKYNKEAERWELESTYDSPYHRKSGEEEK